MATEAAARSSHLTRSLRLWDLVLIGIIMVQPTAPMPLFGVVFQQARGHVVTTVLVALVAMLFTAISYGKMAQVYPSAGSAYTYVGQEIHPGLGFATGWSMMMDYLLNPLICTIWCSKAIMTLIGGIPYGLWALFFSLLFTFMNLRRIRATAKTNAWLTFLMSVVIVAMLVEVGRYVAGMPHFTLAMWLKPFYDPATFSFRNVATGSSIAVLTYIGFDGISTLAEEVHDPRRNILRATVLICLITGVLAAIEVYAAQLIWPVGRPFPDPDTAYIAVAAVAGGKLLAAAVNITLLVATIGSGAAAQMSGARLLYGMGRDNVLPGSFFGIIDPRNHVPSRNVILIGILCFAGAFVLNYELGAELLNFGAFIGFMGVNIAALLHFFVRTQQRSWSIAATSSLGFLVCLAMWISLPWPSKIAGSIWLAAGIAFGFWRTQGFKRAFAFEAPPE